MIRISATPTDLRDVPGIIRELRTLGVDLADLNAVLECTKLEGELQARYRELHRRRESAPTAVRAEALALATGTRPTDTWESLSRDIEITGEAINEASRRSWAALTARADRNLDILRPVYSAAAQQLVALAAALEGIRTIEDAARAGVAQQWLDAETAHQTIKAVRRIHLQWLVDGIVRNRGARAKHEHRKLDHYSPHEFHYEHPVIAASIPATARHDVIGEARRLAAAGVALRSISEVDALTAPAEPPAPVEPHPDIDRGARTAHAKAQRLGINVFQ